MLSQAPTINQNLTYQKVMSFNLIFSGKLF